MIYVVTTRREESAFMPDYRYVHLKKEFGQNICRIFADDEEDFGFITPDDIVLVQTRDRNIIEELVGEIWDEHDEVEELYRQISDDEYLVKGFSNASDVLEKLGVETKEEFDAVTIGGWVIEEIGTIPKVGATFEFENIRVTVMKANAKRVLEVKIKMLPKVEEEDEE